MLKLHDIFLKKFLLLFIVMFCITSIVLYFWIKDVYVNQAKTDLLHNINILSLKISSKENLNDIAKKIKKITTLRVTIISENGLVLGESHKDYRIMNNHLNRAEIIEANNNKYGSIARHSKTLNKKLLYVAKKHKIDNLVIYIRMSKEIKDINKEFLYLFIKIGFLFMIFIAITSLITFNMSQKVQNETKNILDFLRQLTKQLKPIKIKSTYSVEFNQITKLLTIVSKNLSKKETLKAKYTHKLKLSNQQKDDIISAISHEFKNPIAVISGYSQTLLEDQDINDQIRQKFLSKISSNALKISNMIDKSRLSISLNKNKQLSNQKPCYINKIIYNIIEDMKLAYPNRKIELKSKKVTIIADEMMINIAIENIIENALKYSKDTIKIEIDKKYISIQDYGIGISQDDISKITNKYYRVSTNNWNNSLGIGLNLVKNILSLHGFKLDIKSKLNSGSIFKIILK